MPGILRVRGTIEIDQFWPHGESDADTTKIKVNVDENAFAFAANGTTFKTTKAFFGAFVRGASKKAMIDNKGRITVRLQGVDAPELHYRAAALRKGASISDAKRTKFNTLNKVERRQYWAESATVALARKLSNFGTSSIKCQVISLVDHPFEVIDTYGRFVANIRVGPSFKTDINVWLVQEGWVYPTYYSSMTVEEIKTLEAAAMKGKAKKRAWKDYSKAVNTFDKKLVYRAHGPLAAAKDRGPVLMPKLYRRQVSFRMQKAAGVVSGSFAAFLASSPDRCFLTDDFVEQSVHTAPMRSLHEFVKGTKFTLDPNDMVFREKFSTLVNAAGKVIQDF